MRTPDSLLSLIDEGIISQVMRPLMSGKEAQVYLVRSGDALRVAKVYKEAEHRSFKQRAEYTEGRTVRNTRDQRAMTKRTRHGRAQDEAAWRTTEVDMIYRLRAAGVRVPEPHHFVDGVLIMELVTDAEGNPAPRLGDLNLDRAGATAVFERVLGEVVRMLAAGVVHGDLSDFNVLMGADGPVIIDFPQAVDASGNRNARKLLLRDVDNLHRFLSKFVPGRQAPPFAQEMWQLYERGELTPDTQLTGRFRAQDHKVVTNDVLSLISDAERDERRRRDALGMRMRGGTSTGTGTGPFDGSARTQSGPQRGAPHPAHRGQGVAPNHGGRGPSRGPAQPNVIVEVRRSAQHAPQHAPQQPPQHPPQHDPRRAPQHDPRRAPQHDPRRAPQHAPQHAPRHAPQNDAQHGSERPSPQGEADQSGAAAHKRRRRRRRRKPGAGGAPPQP